MGFLEACQLMDEEEEEVAIGLELLEVKKGKSRHPHGFVERL